MKKEYKKQKGENLAQWCERIAAACQGRSLTEVHEMISEVSMTSYIEGVLAEREINKKYNPLNPCHPRSRKKIISD